MRTKRKRSEVADKFDRGDSSRSIKGRLRPVLSRDQVKRRVLGMTEKLGLLSPQRHWRLASWFVAFAIAPDPTALRRFKDEAEFLASTRGASALREEITDQDFFHVRAEVQKTIAWALDEKAKVKGASTAPLIPIPVDLLLHRVGNRFEKGIVPLDFRARLLSFLFDLVSSGMPLARCATCQKIFTRKGRQLYCSQRCAEKARPAGARRTYLRQYMRKRRARMKRLEARAPDLAEKVADREISLRKGLRGLARRRTA